MKKQEFDITLNENIGKPYYFDLGVYIEAIKMQICSDEIERALWMCDNPPAWYRENYPKELQEIKDTLYRNLYDGFDYANDADEAGWTREDASKQCLSDYTYPRANILFEEIKALNDTGHTPFVCELSTSHGWLPVGFSDRGLKFNFFSKNLNSEALKKVKSWLPDGLWQERPRADQVRMFVFFEALEHMYREDDLLQSYKKIDIDFDHIYLSTPLGTLWGGLPDWDTRRLGHVRAYTPQDFINLAEKYFKGYRWTFYRNHSMVLVGKKIPKCST